MVVFIQISRQINLSLSSPHRCTFLTSKFSLFVFLLHIIYVFFGIEKTSSILFKVMASTQFQWSISDLMYMFWCIQLFNAKISYCLSITLILTERYVKIIYFIKSFEFFTKSKLKVKIKREIEGKTISQLALSLTRTTVVFIYYSFN